MSNPILMAELAPRRLRGGVNRLQWLHVTVLLVELVLCLWIALQSQVTEVVNGRAPPWQGVFWNFYSLFIVQHVAALTLLAPIFAAGSITREKALGTFELLLTTPLTDADIVLGKWLAHVFQAVRWTLPSWPLLAFFQGLLDLPGTTLLLWLAGTLLWTATSTTVSLVCSALIRNGAAALLASYLLLAALLTGLFRFADLGTLVPWDTPTILDAWRSLAVWAPLAVAVLPLAILSLSLRKLHRWQHSDAKRTASHARAELPPVGFEPIYWKQLLVGTSMRMSLLRRFSRRSRAVLWIAATCTFASAFTPSALSVVIALFTLLYALPFFAAVLGSAAIAPEREQQTWDAIRLTALEPEEIVAQLRRAIVETMLGAWRLSSLAVAVLVLRLTEGESWTVSAMVAIPVFGAWALNRCTIPLAVMAGLRASARAPTFWRSLVPTIFECMGYALLFATASFVIGLMVSLVFVPLLFAALCSGKEEIGFVILSLYFGVYGVCVYWYHASFANQVGDGLFTAAVEELEAKKLRGVDPGPREPPSEPRRDRRKARLSE